MKKNLITLAILLVIILSKAFAQSESTDTSFYNNSIAGAIGLYYKSVGENAHLFNGSEYMLYNVYSPIENKNPYFMSIFLQNGSVTYDGISYSNIPLCYDIYLEQLITMRYNQTFRIRLVEDKLTSFDFAGHHFIRLSEDSLHKLPYGSGFYEEIYSGKTILLAKRKKKREERYANAEFSALFTQDDHFFILKDGVFYPVNSKKTVLSVYQDKKKELKKYLRKNHISFRPAPEFGIMKAAEYYDQIKN